MPISRLSDDTTRALGSALVLNDSTSVVKELIDNALDAQATAITVEISPNSVDIIQIRDNGTGIAIEDRQLLCKRGCTSKICSIRDLENLGGRFLGFRGEALASVAELSEKVTITTRVKGEIVGTTLDFGPRGTMSSSASASHPVGTTVRIQNFLIPIPVRKQTVLKNSAKILADIKTLLFHYAFARPTVRLNYKILKGKHEKLNWSFTPCDASDQLVPVAAQVVGKEVINRSKQLSMTSPTIDGHSYIVNALLLENLPEIPKLSNTGQYIAIDNRPVMADRGTMKDIVNLYKTCLTSSSQAESRISSKPFIALKLSCSQGSYDVNIEPAKDDVLFHHPEAVKDLLHILFEKMYGPIEVRELVRGKSDHVPLRGDAPAFDIFLARKAPEAISRLPATPRTFISPQPVLHDSITLGPRESDTSASHARSQSSTLGDSPHQPLASVDNMYDLDDEDELFERPHGITPSSTGGIDESSTGNAANWAKNPFTTAALYAKVSPKQLTPTCLTISDGDQSPNTAIETASLLHSSPVRTEAQIMRRDERTWYLPTPSRSPTRKPYQNPGPPIPRRSRQEQEADDAGSSFEQSHTPDLVMQPQQDFLRRWTQKGEDRTPLHAGNAVGVVSKSTATGFGIEQHELPHNLAAYSSKLADSPCATETRPIHLKSFKSPPRHREKPPMSRSTDEPGMITFPMTQPCSELESIMDFEYRKRAVNHHSYIDRPGPKPTNLTRTQHNAGVRAPVVSALPTASDSVISPPILFATSSIADSVEALSPPKSSPHHNRYRSALQNLEQRSSERLGMKSEYAKAADMGMPSSDPRASLIAEKRTENAPSDLQAKRTKSSRLPLEGIPKDHDKHNMMCFISDTFPPSDKLGRSVKSLEMTDEYVKSGKVKSSEWNPFSKQVESWQLRLERLVKQTYRASSTVNSNHVNPSEHLPGPNTDTSDLVFEVNLVRAIKGHLQMLSEQDNRSSI